MGEGEGGDCAPANVPSSSEAAAAGGVVAALDAPAKKLARQLDFTALSEQSQQLQPQVQQQLQSVAQQPVTVLPSPPPPPQQAPLASVRVG